MKDVEQFGKEFMICSVYREGNDGKYFRRVQQSQACVLRKQIFNEVLKLITRRAWKEREQIGGYCILNFWQQNFNIKTFFDRINHMYYQLDMTDQKQS